MEKQHHYSLVLTFSIVISLGLATFASCFIAESKKAQVRLIFLEYCFCSESYLVISIIVFLFLQVKDLKVDGKLCYLPGSNAYKYGVVALVCLGIAHVVGNLQICANFCSREKRSSSKAKTPAIVTVVVIFSW